MTDSEREFTRMLKGDSVDLDRVRIVDGAPTRAVTFNRPARPRTTCRERLLPPIEDAVVTSKPAAVAFYNRILFDKDWYTEDYVPEFPDKINIVAAMLFAHEMTHVWQWQNRKETGYTPLRAAFEHRGSRDPYLFDLDNKAAFEDFGFEQQGTIMEEYVCCRALAPTADRTKRLHNLISNAMPISPLPQSRAFAVGLPWDGVEIEGICG